MHTCKSLGFMPERIHFTKQVTHGQANYNLCLHWHSARYCTLTTRLVTHLYCTPWQFVRVKEPLQDLLEVLMDSSVWAAAGGVKVLDLGAACKFPSGVVYAAPSGKCASPAGSSASTDDRSKVNLMELNINAADGPDNYDLSAKVSNSGTCTVGNCNDCCWGLTEWWPWYSKNAKV